MGSKWRSRKISETNLERKKNEFGSTKAKSGRKKVFVGKIRKEVKKEKERWKKQDGEQEKRVNC
jgi:hypothetical protein